MNPSTRIHSALLTSGSAIAMALSSMVLCAPAAIAADAVISGLVRDASGAPMGGVTVSAKAAGSTITTSVYTDEQGAYYFPALPAGKKGGGAGAGL